MMNDPRFVKSSVVWGLIEHTNISLPEGMIYYQPDEEAELIRYIEPQVESLEKIMVLRLYVLIGLILVYVFIILVEILCRWIMW